MFLIQGTGVTRGIAIGPASFHRPAPIKIVPRKPGPVAEEEARFAAALDAARAGVQALRAALPRDLWAEVNRLLEVHEILLADPALVDRTRGSILQGKAAEWAWKESVEAYLAIFSPLQDEDLRARAAALGDVGRQVLAAMLGEAATAPSAAGRETVVLASMLGPTEFLQLAAQPPLGLCLAGSPLAAPAVVVARRLGIPVVVGLGEALLKQVPAGITLVVDGGSGLVEVDPDEEALAYQRDRQRLLRAAQPDFDVMAPAHTRDGWRVDVRVELARPEDLLLALACGAEGVGLAHSDFLYVGRQALPGEDEQAAAFRALLLQLPADRLTCCTLAVGPEEPLPFPSEAEGGGHPLLGLRGIRLSLAYLSAFREQLRALLRAGAGRPLGIAFPMVETISELRAAQEWLRRAQQDLRNAEIAHCQDVISSVLVQTPLAMLNIEALLPEIGAVFLDFDRLAEYILACDRQNRRVAHLFRPLHPTVLRLVRDAVTATHRHGRRVDLCGDSAGSLGAVALLLGLGADGFCLPIERIAGAKALLRQMTVPEAQDLAGRALRLQSAAEVESLVEEFLGHKVVSR